MNLARNSQTHPKEREAVGSYIYGRLGRAGFMTLMQTFLAKDMPPLGGPVDKNKVSNAPNDAPNHQLGGNIIGVLPGAHWGSALDAPIIVGAHWDTVPDSPGFDDNGSGVAALLEVASVLARSKCFNPDYSVIIAAFDLEEPGCYGSQEFVINYLKRDFLDFGIDIQGAIILDTVSNFDPDSGSQTISPRWKSVVAGQTLANIVERGSRGDFLAMISRGDPVDKERRIAEKIQKYFTLLSEKPGRKPSFRIEHFRLPGLSGSTGQMPSLETLFDHSSFWRSDNSRFWFNRDSSGYQSLASVLLTDTGKYVCHGCFHSKHLCILRTH